MNRLLPLLLFFPSLIHGQNVGVDVGSPLEKLDIAGRLRLSSDIGAGAPTGGAGTIRWNASAGAFQGWNGSVWTSFSSAAETDPIFGASPSAGITGINITNWNTAFGWGNHATAGYLTSFTELDPTWDGAANFTGDINRAGNVGIGGAPSEKLHVTGNVRSTTGFIANDGSAGTPAIRFSSSPTTGIYRQAADAIGVSTAGVERIRVAASGNVGIGLSADPTELLEVAGNVKLTRAAHREIAVAMEPSTNTSQPAKNLTVRAGNANFDDNGFAQRGGDLVLQAGRGFTNTVPNAHGGHVILRSGANHLNSGSEKNGGDIILETGGPSNAVTERMRFSDTGVLTLPTINTSGSNRVLTISSTGIVSATNMDPANVGTVTSVTASNGLTSSGGAAPNITLGGSLTGNTTIAQAANTLEFTSSTVNGFSVDGNTFSVDAANNRVGIGNAAPAQKLAVSGAVEIGTTTTATTGTLRWNPDTNDFEGYDGMKWWSLSGMQERTMMYTGGF